MTGYDQPVARRRLPIGLQTFREVREQDCYYVDKTAHIGRLLAEGKHYFLSRPRRFGKSLFLDTLKELFEGNEALFEGLHIHDGWEWSVRHPVVRLDFAGGSFKETDHLHEDVMLQLEYLEEQAGIAPRQVNAPARFRRLLQALHRTTGQPVAVLVDEYDKPILDALETPEVARANRDFLRGLYGMIKSSDAHVHFTFVTGVSKFTKVSLCSDLNNLTDITLDPVFSSICGYTEEDLDRVFAPELAGMDRQRIRDWYNGYGWLGGEKVYNPFDVLLLLRRRKFAAHWFETGTPAFLVKTLFERRVASVSLDGMVGTEELLSTFDVGNIGTEALLFQTGYLTITGEEEMGGLPLYRLGYPNREVRQSLNRVLLHQLVQDAEQQTANSMRLAPACGARLRRPEGVVPRLLREHPVSMVYEQPHRGLRGILRERVLLLFCGARLRNRGGRVEQPRAAGHGGARRRRRVSVRVQGRRAGAAGIGAGAVAGAGLRGKVPGSGRVHSPDRGRVQPQDTQRDGVRGGRWLTPGCRLMPCRSSRRICE